MRLKISHRTEYRYDTPVAYALQRLRLVPANGPTQTVHDWSLKIEGAREEVRFKDQFANDTRLVSLEDGSQSIVIEAVGDVETRDCTGVFGRHQEFTPLWLFNAETPLTHAGEGICALAASVLEQTDLARLHRLMAIISERMKFEIGVTGTQTTAEEALALGSGVCQDYSHIFIAAARVMGFPARYIGGYLKRDEVVEQVASHAWAEAHVAGLGWVAFDAANCISTDDRYVRVANGRDYRDAMPVSGIRLGQGQEQLAVAITVEQ